MQEFFIEYKSIFVVVHAFAAAIGLGAVVVTDTLFFRFLKDFKISKSEDDVMTTISTVIWIIIGLLAVSGLVLYLSAPADYIIKSKFITKLVVFSVIVVNGIVLNIWLAPNLKKIVFGGEGVKKLSSKLQVLRKVAFASGVISITSWVVVFLLGSLRSIPLNTQTALLVYAGLLLIGVTGSQLYAWKIGSHTK